MATIGSVSPVGTIATNPAAAVVTVMKMTVDFQSGKPIQFGDFVSVAGNILATAGAVAFFVIPGSQLVDLGFVVVGNFLNVSGLYLDRHSIGDALKSVYGDIVKNGSVPANSPDGATLQSFIADHNAKNSGGATVAAVFNTDDTVGKIVSYDKTGNVIQTDSYTYTHDGAGAVATVTESIYNANGTLLSTTVTNADNSSVTTAYKSPADSHLITVTTTDANGKVTQIATTIAGTSPNTYDTTVTDGSGKLLYKQTGTYVNGVLSSQSEYDPSGALTRQYSYLSGKLVAVNTYSGGALIGHIDYLYDENGTLYGVNASGTDTITANNASINLANVPGANLTLVGTGDTVVAMRPDVPYRAYDSVFNLVAGDSVKIVDMGGNTINGGAGEAITLTSSGDTINVSGDSANRVAADGQAAGITLTKGAEGIFIGSGNTIRAAEGAFIMKATGDDIVLNGNGVYVESGGGNRIAAADGTSMNINGETNDTISGNNEAINLSGGSVTLKGTGDVVSGNGTLTLTGNTSVTVNGNSTINAGAGEAIIVEGAASNVTINANGDAADSKTADGRATGIVLGRNDNATIVGAGNAVMAAGNNKLTASHDDITLNGTGVTVTGTGNHITAIDNATVTLSGANTPFDETIAGNGETITSLGQGSLTLQGTGDIVTASGSTVTLANAGSSLTMSGSGDTIVAGGGDAITIASAPARIPLINYTLSGSGSNSVVLGQNINLSINSSGNAITAAGNDDITGSGNKIALTGAGTSITGDNNAITASGTTVYFSLGNNDTLSGNNNTIWGRDATLTLEGTGDTLAASDTTAKLGAGVSVTVSGDHDAVYAGAGNAVTINVSTDGFRPSRTIVYASNDTTGIVVNQRAQADIYGTGDSITAQGANSIAADGDTVILIGSDTTVIGDNDVLHAADNLSLSVYGSNDVVFGNNESITSGRGSLTLNGSGDSVTTYGSTLTANGVGVTLNGPDNTIVGDNDALTIGSDTTNLTVQGAGETIVLSDSKITAASLKVSASANGKDLLLTDSATGNQRIAFDGMLVSGNQGATQLKFADGTVWTRAQMLSMVYAAGAPSVPPPPVEPSGKHSTDVQVSQLIHAMAAFSANQSSADWTSPASSITADAAVLAVGNQAWHQQRP